MSILEELYASGGGDVILSTFEIFSSAFEPIIFVADYQDHVITTEDSRVLTAQQASIQIAEPKRDANGSHNIRFAIGGVRAESSNIVRRAIRAQAQVNLTYRRYLYSDLTAPAEEPYFLIVRKAQFYDDVIQVDAGLFDLIDLKYPREVYNSVNAPGLRYL